MLCPWGTYYLFIRGICEFTFTHRDLSVSSNRWESLFIDIQHENIKTKITLGNIYRPPRRNNCNNEIEQFLNELRPVNETLHKESSFVFLAGDYNINLLEIQDREKNQEYLDLHVSHGLYPKITLPTRFSKKNCTLIDQIFCTHSTKTQNSISGILFGSLSDHFAYFTGANIFEKNRKSTEKFTKVFNHSQTDINNFCTEVHNILNRTGLDNNLLSNPTDNYNKLEKILTTARENHIPTKIERVKKYKHKLTSWITTSIIKSIKFRDCIYKNLKSCLPDSDSYRHFHVNLHTFNGILQKN